MLLTNQTSQDYWFGPLHLAAGIGSTLTVDDTSETSLYLTNDAVATAINTAYSAGVINVTGAAVTFPRATSGPEILYSSGSPEGAIFAPQGSMYMRRDATDATSSLYFKTTGCELNTGWEIVGAPTPPLQYMRATGAASGGSTAPNGFRAFNWTQTDGSTILDLSTNVPLVLLDGYYSIQLRVETTATLNSGAEWQAFARARSTPWGPSGAFGDAQIAESRFYSNGTVAGARQSVTLLPTLMSVAGTDRFDFNVFHTNSTTLTGGAAATASLYVVYQAA